MPTASTVPAMSVPGIGFFGLRRPVAIRITIRLAGHHDPVADVDRRCVDADQHLAVADLRALHVLELEDLGSTVPVSESTAFIVSCLQQRRGPGGPVPFRDCRGCWIDRRLPEGRPPTESARRSRWCLLGAWHRVCTEVPIGSAPPFPRRGSQARQRGVRALHARLEGERPRHSRGLSVVVSDHARRSKDGETLSLRRVPTRRYRR